jgi:glycosyltransferase involved in cell wall biosynthesis
MYNLTLAMIVKNEASNIEECLKSVVKYIDYYVIADTGSIDNTKEIIKNFFDSHNIPGEILDHEWEDFGTNRSKVLKHCHGKTKWALMIDADDYVEGNLPVSTFDDQYDGYVVKIARGPMIWYRAQIFNLNKKLWWYEEPLHEYAICEQPMNVPRLEGDYAWVVRTQGCRSKSVNSDREKYARDYFFLKGYLEKEPNQARKQFYAAQSAFDAQLYEVAEKEYLLRVQLGNWPEEVFYSWVRIGICREILGRPLPEIADAFLQAYEVRPNRAEPLYHLSCIYRKHGRPKDAFLIASGGLTIEVNHEDILFVDNSVYEWGILDEVATTAYYVGKFHMGLAACEKLLSEPYLPPEHKERVTNNRNIYLKTIEEIQKQKVQPILEKQKEVEAKIKKEVDKTTFDKKLDELQAVKL